MKILVPLVLLFLTWAFWLASDEKSDIGKSPQEEQVIHIQEVNKVTGELMDVQILRCRVCGQVLSYVQFNHLGKVIYGFGYKQHRCGKYGIKEVAHYSGSGVWKDFDFLDFLERWQRRLQVKR